MNKVILSGRLSKDIEFGTTNNGVDYARSTIAVNRRFKNESGEYDADFINIVAWRNTAKYLNDYAKKGNKIAVCGTLQTRTYEAQDGTKRYATEVVVDEAEILESKNKEEKQEQLKEIPDSELPF